MKSKFVILALAAVACAQAQLVVGNDQSGSASIYVIDVGTGVATPLLTGSTAEFKPWGMAADNTNSILYWNNGGNLYSASYGDLIGGTAAPTPLAMTFNSSSVNFVGLGFDPVSGKLLGTRNIATEAVYEIDPVTGVATQLYVYSSTLDFGGLDYDTDTSTLYGLSDAPSTARGLYDIDYVGATTTMVAAYPGGETDIDGLAVGGGNAYFVTDGPNATQANFYVYDIATATQTGTIASPFTAGGTFCGAAWAPGLVVPEPGTVVAVGLGLLSLVALRRKR